MILVKKEFIALSNEATNTKGELYKQFSFCIKKAFYYFITPILASMLSVACGTARKRALSINLPVTRQMP